MVHNVRPGNATATTLSTFSREDETRDGTVRVSDADFQSTILHACCSVMRTEKGERACLRAAVAAARSGTAPRTHKRLTSRGWERVAITPPFARHADDKQLACDTWLLRSYQERGVVHSRMQ